MTQYCNSQTFCGGFDHTNLCNFFLWFHMITKSNVHFFKLNHLTIFVRIYDIFSPISERVGIRHIFRTVGDTSVIVQQQKNYPSTFIFFVSFSLLECKSIIKQPKLKIEPIQPRVSDYHKNHLYIYRRAYFLSLKFTMIR